RLQLRPGVAVDMFGVTFEARRYRAGHLEGWHSPCSVVTVRAENTTDIVVLSPDVAVTCEENRAGGEWFKDSTWETNVVLPPGVVSEGQLIAGLPYKEDAPRRSRSWNAPNPSCGSPPPEVVTVIRSWPP
ncbi:MAG: hypothetical protein V9G12_17575, partial [Microthrixaceae bacterium]